MVVDETGLIVLRSHLFRCLDGCQQARPGTLEMPRVHRDPDPVIDSRFPLNFKGQGRVSGGPVFASHWPSPSWLRFL
jgi:hypothetical protein